MALLKPRNEWARSSNAHKVYIGRRMYFPTEAVAALLGPTESTRGGALGEAGRDSGEQ